jgi:hypothetical protein
VIETLNVQDTQMSFPSGYGDGDLVIQLLIDETPAEW